MDYDIIKETKKRMARLRNKPVISPFFSLIQHFEKGDYDQIYKKETFKESLKLSMMYAIANLFTLAFFVSAARLLGVIDYSELGVLLSFFFIFATATNLFNIVIIKYLSYFIAKTQYEKISYFCSIYVKLNALAGFVVLLILLAFSRILGDLLSLKPMHIIALGVLIWAFLIWNSLMGVLNGLQYFTLLGLNRIFQAFFSALFGLALLLMGFNAAGAIFGMALGTFIAIPLGSFSARNIFFIYPHKLGKMRFLQYLVPSTIVVLCAGIILNIDLPLVRRFLSPVESGNYSAVSLMSSIVFSFSMVACMVMFPKVAQLASNGEKTEFLLRKALRYVIYTCTATTILYFIFSKTMVGLVFGPEFKISQYIGLYALAMSIWAVSAVLIMYNLALEKGFLWYLALLATIIEFVLIRLIHFNIWAVIIVMVGFHILLLAVLIKLTKADLGLSRKRKGFVDIEKISPM